MRSNRFPGIGFFLTRLGVSTLTTLPLASVFPQQYPMHGSLSERLLGGRASDGCRILIRMTGLPYDGATFLPLPWGRGHFLNFHDLRPNGLFYPRLPHSIQADAICFVAVFARLKNATHFIDA